MPDKNELHHSGDSGDGRMLYHKLSCPAGTRDASNLVPALLEPGAGNF